MNYRIIDPRLATPDAELAMILDLLCACCTAADVDFMFPELAHVSDDTWRVPVDVDRALRFELSLSSGAYNVRLE